MRPRFAKSALFGTAAIVALSLAGTGVAMATPINWVFYNHDGGGQVLSGDSNHSVTFNSTPELTPGQEVTLTPFGPNSPYLYQKNGLYPTTTGVTPGEQGIGLTNDPTGDNEISQYSETNPSFVQVDISNLSANYLTLNLGVSMGSLPKTDLWAVYGSNDPGTFTMDATHRLAQTSTKQYTGTLHDVIGNYKYLDVIATQGNVLLSTLSAEVPEPGSLSILGAGLLLLGLGARRKRRLS